MITITDQHNADKQHHFFKSASNEWMYQQSIMGAYLNKPRLAVYTGYYSLLMEYLKNVQAQIDSDISSLDILIQCGDKEKALKLLRTIKQQLDTVKTIKA